MQRRPLEIVAVNQLFVSVTKEVTLVTIVYVCGLCDNITSNMDPYNYVEPLMFNIRDGGGSLHTLQMTSFSSHVSLAAY